MFKYHYNISYVGNKKALVLGKKELEHNHGSSSKIDRDIPKAAASTTNQLDMNQSIEYK